MTIAQIVYDNEMHFGYTDQEVHDKVGSLLCQYATARTYSIFVLCPSSFEYGASWTTASALVYPRPKQNCQAACSSGAGLPSSTDG